jgi:arylamine N-acetyltransferase
MNPQADIPLDPREHPDGAKTFMEAYGLAAGRPRLELFERLVEAFARLPYENISKIIKLNQRRESSERIRLPEELMRDHLQERLGGTCFSLTFTLQTILSHNGFSCYPVMAHMRAGRNIHCGLVVLVDDMKYLVDPGYLLGRPVELDPRHPISFSNEFSRVELRFQPKESSYHLYTASEQERKWRYSFSDRPTSPREFLQHWQDSFTKNAMHGICLNRVTPKGLIYVRKKFMREITPGDKRNIDIKRNYHAAIQEAFGIRQDLVEQALAALEANMAWERERGLYRPKEGSYETVGS